VGSPTDRLWGKQFEKFYRGLRVLEAGSGHKNSVVIRETVESSGTTYIGVDMIEHENVDIVHNLDNPMDIEPVDMVIALSLLEHCEHPWLVANTLQDVLKPGGVLMVCAPFAWRVHNYPYDYWRFTPMGFRSLFKDIEWKELGPIPDKPLDRHPTERIMLHGWGRKV